VLRRGVCAGLVAGAESLEMTTAWRARAVSGANRPPERTVRTGAATPPGDRFNLNLSPSDHVGEV
jgi:hypothetical protein